MKVSRDSVVISTMSIALGNEAKAVLNFCDFRDCKNVKKLNTCEKQVPRNLLPYYTKKTDTDIHKEVLCFVDCSQSLYFLRWNRCAVTIDRGATILDYLASEIWGEDKTPLGTGSPRPAPRILPYPVNCLFVLDQVHLIYHNSVHDLYHGWKNLYWTEHC